MTTILSLDDCPNIIELMHVILSRAGYNHIGVNSNEAALEALRREPVDLLIQDIKRPGMDGWMFYDYVQQDPVLREIPVLIVSAGTPNRAEPAYYQVDGYLTKPFSPRQVRDEVKRILQLYQERDDAGQRVRREVILRRRLREHEQLAQAALTPDWNGQEINPRTQSILSAIMLVVAEHLPSDESVSPHLPSSRTLGKATLPPQDTP